MKRTVRWSQQSLDDLKQNLDYISDDNPDAGQRVIDRIRATGDNLGDFATGHPGRFGKTYEKSVTRLPYIIVYRLETGERGETVVILRVIHMSRDWRDDELPS